MNWSINAIKHTLCVGTPHNCGGTNKCRREREATRDFEDYMQVVLEIMRRLNE